MGIQGRNSNNARQNQNRLTFDLILFDLDDAATGHVRRIIFQGG